MNEQRCAPPEYVGFAKRVHDKVRAAVASEYHKGVLYGIAHPGHGPLHCGYCRETLRQAAMFDPTAYTRACAEYLHERHDETWGPNEYAAAATEFYLNLLGVPS